MFGQDDTDKPQGPGDGADALTAALPDPIDASAAAKPVDDAALTTPTLPTTVNPSPPADSSGVGAPNLPVDDEADDKPEPENDEPTEPANDEPPATSSFSSPSSSTATDGDDLLAIKQQALEHLSPLVGHLDQTPEEKFRTTMMMIQASDNKDLVKDAFEAAQAITDEKTRAQALLDVINEINYFTSPPEAKPEA